MKSKLYARARRVLSSHAARSHALFVCLALMACSWPPRPNHPSDHTPQVVVTPPQLQTTAAAAATAPAPVAAANSPVRGVWNEPRAGGGAVVGAARTSPHRGWSR